MQLSPLTDEALSDRALKVLREAIIAMRLQPGDPLVERQIAQQLGISTTPVREAIRQLANEGLVTIAVNRSAVVRGLTPADIDEIFGLRDILEPMALRLAVERRGDEVVRAMAAVLERSARANETGDFAALAECNRAFNEAFVQTCGNRRLQAILESLHAQTRQISVLVQKYRRSAPLDHEQHQRILDAVRRGDWEAADAATRDHLRSGRDVFLHALAQYREELVAADGNVRGLLQPAD